MCYGNIQYFNTFPSSHFSLYFNTGITLSGLEDPPLTVGQPATITCSTNINVSSIEWRNESSAVLSSTMDGGTHSMLDYTIHLVSDDLQGQEYSCNAEAADGTVYNETVRIEVVGKFIIIIIIPLHPSNCLGSNPRHPAF